MTLTARDIVRANLRGCAQEAHYPDPDARADELLAALTEQILAEQQTTIRARVTPVLEDACTGSGIAPRFLIDRVVEALVTRTPWTDEETTHP